MPGRRRFRPILRMNDLLHPIQQRERLEVFSNRPEKSTYSTYSRLWVARQAPALLSIKAPGTAKRLDEETYLVLLQQRVSWMMQSWLRNLQGSQAELEKLLRSASVQIWPQFASERSLLAGDEENCSSLKNWCSEWAEILVQESDRILEVLYLEGIQFPVMTWDANHPNFQEMADLHDETDIETWLSLLATL